MSSPWLPWPVLVGCLNGCAFCPAVAAARENRRRCHLCGAFVPHLHPEILDSLEYQPDPQRVLVAPGADLWTDDTGRRPLDDLPDWRNEIYEALERQPRHRFGLITRRPERVAEDMWMSCLRPAHVWLGVGVEHEADLRQRFAELVAAAGPQHLLVSAEPLLGPLLGESDELPAGIGWLLLGPQTGPRAKTQGPVPEAWFREAVAAAQAQGVPVFVKDSIRRIYPGTQDWPQEIPAELQFGKGRKKAPE
jgi:protein gp37